VKAKREFEECLGKTGLSLEAARAYVEAHPELKRPMYLTPQVKGVVGTAANFVLHLAERMRQEGWRRRPSGKAEAAVA